MVKKYKAELFISDKYEIGDGPIFDPRTGVFSWVDINGGKFCLLYPDGSRKTIEVGKKVGAAMPLERSEGYLLTVADGLYVWENDKLTKVYDMSETYKPGQRSNDGKPDAKGRIIFGSLQDDTDKEPGGCLYSYDNGKVTQLDEGIGLSNGLCWRSDGKKFYYADSMAATVYVYDYDLETGAVSNREVLFKMENGLPDGMTIDADDNLWVGSFFGKSIQCRSSVNGELLAEVEVDANFVTDCAFYGENLDEIFITTCDMGMNGPNDGKLFKCKVDAKGVKPDYAKI